MKRIRMQFAALALALLLPACASQSPAPQPPAEEPEPQITLTGPHCLRPGKHGPSGRSGGRRPLLPFSGRHPLDAGRRGL